VDLDAIPPEQTSGSHPDAIKEAQRLHRAIARIVDVGIEEQGMRQLIQETRNFLHGKPRHLVIVTSDLIISIRGAYLSLQFHDLRVAHRMIAFMCELKSDLRGQRSLNDALNEQMKSLTSEKEALLSKLERSEQERSFERDTALAVEKSLRDHNAVAVRNYHVLIE
jgi:chemotaxis regulatin CheY-phosphate phosphatase CheZ